MDTKVKRKGKIPSNRILIIAGSTAEPIDDIRIITNRSSGKTGIELASEAYQHGGEVILWYGRSCEKCNQYRIS